MATGRTSQNIWQARCEYLTRAGGYEDLQHFGRCIDAARAGTYFNTAVMPAASSSSRAGAGTASRSGTRTRTQTRSRSTAAKGKMAVGTSGL